MHTAHPTSLLSSKSPFKSLHFCLKVYSLQPPSSEIPTHPPPIHVLMIPRSGNTCYTWKLKFRLFGVWGTCVAIADSGWGGVQILIICYSGRAEDLQHSTFPRGLGFLGLTKPGVGGCILKMNFPLYT